MKLRSRQQKKEKSLWDSPEYERAKKRVARMSTHDMVGRADDLSTQMGVFISEFSMERTPEVRSHLLNELKIAASSYQAIIEELITREE